MRCESAMAHLYDDLTTMRVLSMDRQNQILPPDTLHKQQYVSLGGRSEIVIGCQQEIRWRDQKLQTTSALSPERVLKHRCIADCETNVPKACLRRLHSNEQ